MTAPLRVEDRDVFQPDSGPASEPRRPPESQTVVRIALDALNSGPSPREQQLCEHHVSVLSETCDNWPPILVRSRDHIIVDGHHRVAAARRLGLQFVAAVLFDGSDEEAYVKAVSRNIGHGLALSVSERRTAALGILRRHPDWSDRRISAICGLSPTTIANVRRSTPDPCRDLPSEQTGDRRVGTDGRRRPVDRGALRAQIAELVRSDPSASLRSVARLTGASPETVRAVRARLQAHSVADIAEKSECGDEIPTLLEKSQTFTSTQSGRDFLDWFAKTRIGPDDGHTYEQEIPLSRIYEVADEARRRARHWAEFADIVEGRAYKPR